MEPSGHIGRTQGEFSVAQFFDDGSWEYTRRFVDGKEAVDAFFHYVQTFPAKAGIVTRVVLTDVLDFTNMEWKFEEGITFPEEYAGKFKY